MTFVYGGPVKRSIQKALGVKQTAKFDDATRVAVAERFGKSGKKINAAEAAELAAVQVEVVEEQPEE